MRSLPSIILLAACLLVTACDRLTPATPIQDVLKAPASFEGKDIWLKGTVRDITKIPLVDIKAYTLADGTGEITVVTDQTLPAQGVELRLQGRVESAAIIAGQSLGLRVRELQRP